MTTFANVQKATESKVIIFNDETPAGHFGARITFKGHPTFYLFQGEPGDPEAVVKGRIIVIDMQGLEKALAYTEGGLAGGECIGAVHDFKDAFAKMVSVTPSPSPAQ